MMNLQIRDLHLIQSNRAETLSQNRKTTRNNMLRSRLAAATSKGISLKTNALLEMSPQQAPLIDLSCPTTHLVWSLRRHASTTPSMRSSEWPTLSLPSQVSNHSLTQ